MILHALVERLQIAAQALEGGATVVQLRLKGVTTAELVAVGRPYRELCTRHGATFVVNDDVEAALALGADGVHLGRRDRGAERAHAAGLVVGLSAQTFAEAVALAGEAPDYLGVGPVWKTPTKTDARAIGIDELRRICACVDVPVIAIGGIDASNAAACLEAGAAGVAVVRAAADAAAVRAALEHAPV